MAGQMGCCQAVQQFSKHSVVISPRRVSYPTVPSLSDPTHSGAMHLTTNCHACSLLNSSPPPTPYAHPGVSLSLKHHPSYLSSSVFFLASSYPTDSQLPGASLHKPQLFKVNMPRQSNFSNPHTSEPLKLQGASLKGRISRLLQRNQRRSAKCLERGKER